MLNRLEGTNDASYLDIIISRTKKLLVSLGLTCTYDLAVVEYQCPVGGATVQEISSGPCFGWICYHENINFFF